MKKILFALILVGILTGCKKAIEAEPPGTSIVAENAFASDATAIAVVTSLYTKLSTANHSSTVSFGNLSFRGPGLSADEYTIRSAANAQNGYYINNLTPSSAGTELWRNAYSVYLYTCNAAIEGLAASQTLSAKVKTQLTGEAKFMRAVFYFYLVNMYGEVPLVLSTNYKETGIAVRSPVTAVYQQIISDLTDAKGLLSTSYLSQDLMVAGTERIRPIKSAASALLARVHLFQKDWAKAEAEATEVINNTSLFSLESLNSVFLKNSREAIFQLQPTSLYYNTGEGRYTAIPATGFTGTNFLHLSAQLLNSFETGDLRRTDGNWVKRVRISGVDYFQPYKYKIGGPQQNSSVTSAASLSEYLIFIRLGEIFLIRAEARAQQDKLAGAVEDIDKIRSRAGITLLSVSMPGIAKTQLIDAILHEKQVELFSELGHRWFDLKRTGKVDNVMSSITPVKGGTWENTDALYPVPQSDITYNSRLTQNPGY